MMERNVTGIPLENFEGIDCLEYRGPNGEKVPVSGLVVQPGESVEDALRASVAKLGQGWSLFFVPPKDRGVEPT